MDVMMIKLWIQLTYDDVLFVGNKSSVEMIFFFFFQAEDGIRDIGVTGVQTCALPISGHLATSVRDSLEIAHRARAMTTRTVIGQAEGILMERLGLDAEQAFAYLQRTSQDTNRKLAAVAEDIVTTRQLPDLDGTRKTKA